MRIFGRLLRPRLRKQDLQEQPKISTFLLTLEERGGAISGWLGQASLRLYEKGLCPNRGIFHVDPAEALSDRMGQPSDLVSWFILKMASDLWHLRDAEESEWAEFIDRIDNEMLACMRTIEDLLVRYGYSKDEKDALLRILQLPDAADQKIGLLALVSSGPLVAERMVTSYLYTEYFGRQYPAPSVDVMERSTLPHSDSLDDGQTG